MQRTGLSRIALVIAVFCLYLSLTAGLFYWHFTQELAAGNVPKEMRFYEGSVKNGDFWYRVRRASGNPLFPKMVTRLVRLNLETGKESETEFEFDEDYVLPVWVGDTLYIFTQDMIYQAEGNCVTPLEPAPFTTCLSAPFLYDGQVTVIYNVLGLNNSSHENVRLANWIDGRWVEGRRILLPGERFWVDDPQTGHKVLSPRTSEFTERRVYTPTSYYFTYRFMAVQNEQQVHLLSARLGLNCPAYRKGFEFADDLPELPSALAPENAPREVSGWEPILADRADDDWVQMACDKDGLLFASTNHPQRIVRRHFDGRREELTGDTSHKAREIFPWIAVDDSADSTYLIHGDPSWGSATIRRIEGNLLLPPHLIVPGFESEYLARWQRVGWRLLSVWLIPMVVLFACQNWFASGRMIAPIKLKGSPVLLGSLARRTSALLIDLIIFVLLSSLLWRFYLWVSGLVWPDPGNRNLADTLVNIEWSIRSGNLRQLWNSLHNSSMNWLILPFDIDSAFFGIFLASILPVYIARIYLEAKTGVTPGGRLMGIRTVRTTLRDCGVARLLMRDLAFYIDIPFLLSPIPAVISMILSEHNQRIGDRLADTIVIDMKAIRRKITH